MVITQTRVLTLNDGECDTASLYRLQKGWALQFVLGPSLMGRRVRLFTNHPNCYSSVSADGGAKSPPVRFERAVYRTVEWQQGSKIKNDDLSQFAEVECRIAGAFNYYFLCDDNSDTAAPNGSGYFQVAPVLSVGCESEVEEELPLDCVQCQTYLSKLLGPFDEWEDRLRVSKESGYNMIHFTPVQSLGESNSGYSIKDQLAINEAFARDSSRPITYADVKELTTTLKKNWKVLSVQDVVWNHTASNSPFLKEHPECGYNLKNSPHLRPAYLLDRALHQFGITVAQGRWEKTGLPTVINQERHLVVLREILTNNVIPPLKLHEFFQADVDRLCKEFREKLVAAGGPCRDELSKNTLQLVQDPEYRRMESKVDSMDLALKLFNREKPGFIEADRVDDCVRQYRHAVQELNNKAGARGWQILQDAVNALIGHASYERVQPQGRKLVKITDLDTLFPRYFTHPGPDKSLEDEEKDMYRSGNADLMAFNGWVMGDDPLKNFAEAPSMVYLARGLICWSDSVKLRYGKSPADSPYLWQRMADYTRACADAFAGIRMDNCHSTPIHVAEYLLDVARQVKPDLYVFAELFTGSEQVDNIFVNRLGITSLIREAQSAGDAHEEGRLVYKYGGDPVGAFVQRPTRPIAPSTAHALFLDITHDNPCPIQSRTVYDLMPSAALVSMACCATGSNRGYDELVPYAIDVVKESRLYASWQQGTSVDTPKPGVVSIDSGIIRAKRAFNRLHMELGARGFTQVYVDQMTSDVVAVTRHNPITHESVVLVARTCFSPDKLGGFGYMKPVRVNGDLGDIIFEMRLRYKRSGSDHFPHESARPSADSVASAPGADDFLLGLTDYAVELKENVKFYSSSMADVNNISDDPRSPVTHEIELKDFRPGSVIAFRVRLHQDSKQAITEMRQGLKGFGYRVRSLSNRSITESRSSTISVDSIFRRLSLADANRALFRCHEEEANEGWGGGAYTLDVFGKFVYCGLQGVIPMINDIRLKNDLGHPLCDNLRNGNWLADYYRDRLTQQPSTLELSKWFKQLFAPLDRIPQFLRPSYFDATTFGSFAKIRESVWEKMPPFVRNGSDFLRALALASVAFAGDCRSGRLPALSANVTPTPPRGQDGQQRLATLSAGLPHFSHGIFRNWGRDSFIALPGCFLLTGRYDDAKYMILAYGGTLRHGLIPNLLGEGKCARYNCRDSVWWWLNAIRLYVKMAPNGEELLKQPVLRIYPRDETEYGTEVKEEPLAVTMQEALQRHFDGIAFRERNAGHAIDEHMADDGFNLTARICPETGLVMGGNGHNCGTWMDKMGSSDKSGNRRHPATPRDGAAVELQGLAYVTAKWLAELAERKLYPFTGFTRTEHGNSLTWDWSTWASKMEGNFEKAFYVPEDANALPAETNPKGKLVNRRGIVKDCYGSTHEYTDYQLRPNFAITLALAPELLTPENGTKSVETAMKLLDAPLGIKTLDPGDMNYNGNYDNANDSCDYKLAKGFNYHQGPEWLWVKAYFLRAKLAVAWRRFQQDKNEADWQKVVRDVKRSLAPLWIHIKESAWRSLPELTNKDGAVCPGSCPAQAWSVGCTLEVLHDLQTYDAA